jgi:hypothetical protein
VDRAAWQLTDPENLRLASKQLDYTAQQVLLVL